MSRCTVSTRAGFLGAGAVIVVALGALILGGLRGVAVRAFALQAPNQYPLVTLAPGQTVCEGPVSSPHPFRIVAIWGAAVGGRATLQVTARTAALGHVLAAGTSVAHNVDDEEQTTLSAPIRSATPITVCVTDAQGHFSIAGGSAVHPGIAMTGTPANREFSLLLLSEPQSLISALPIAFSRAALFRPGWVGAWTFWVLIGGVLAGFGLALVAVIRALDADAGGDERGAGSAPR